MATKITYTVETLNRPYAGRIPWGEAIRSNTLTERKAISLHNYYARWYHPEGGGYSGHVRIVGSDDWTYSIEDPMPGERASLTRLYHLEDLGW